MREDLDRRESKLEEAATEGKARRKQQQGEEWGKDKVAPEKAMVSNESEGQRALLYKWVTFRFFSIC